MDIKSLYTVEAHESGAEMRVKDQYGKLTDMYITVSGVDSLAWRAEKLSMEKEALKKYGEFEESLDSKKIAEESDKLTSKGLANITLSWRGFVSDGEDFEFTKERAAELYTCAPYIRKQLDDFFSNRVNFTSGKVTS
jgi:hypothetical protein